MSKRMVFLMTFVVAGAAAASVIVFSRADRTEPADRSLVGEASTPTPAPVGRDIGLEFRVCHVSKLEGIDLLGDGPSGTAWTATNVTNKGKCNKDFDDSYLVAIDVTGDGRADASWRALRWCLVCRPIGGTDIDNNGTEELIILEQGGSVSSYLVFSATRRSDDQVRLAPIRVAAPGNLAGDVPPRKPLYLWVGGDEGFSAGIGCESYPQNPILVLAWSNHPIEGPGSETTEIHVTRLKLIDGVFHVVGASNTEQATGYETPAEVPASRSRACGIDLGENS